jgi:hypothetical protein
MEVVISLFMLVGLLAVGFAAGYLFPHSTKKEEEKVVEHEIKAGDIYRLKTQEDCPFTDSLEIVEVEILDVKNGWVKYIFVIPAYPKTALTIKIEKLDKFLGIYTYMRNSGGENAVV